MSSALPGPRRAGPVVMANRRAREAPSSWDFFAVSRLIQPSMVLSLSHDVISA